MRNNKPRNNEKKPSNQPEYYVDYSINRTLQYVEQENHMLQCSLQSLEEMVYVQQHHTNNLEDYLMNSKASCNRLSIMCHKRTKDIQDARKRQEETDVCNSDIKDKNKTLEDELNKATKALADSDSEKVRLQHQIDEMSRVKIVSKSLDNINARPHNNGVAFARNPPREITGHIIFSFDEVLRIVQSNSEDSVTTFLVIRGEIRGNRNPQFTDYEKCYGTALKAAGEKNRLRAVVSILPDKPRFVSIKVSRIQASCTSGGR